MECRAAIRVVLHPNTSVMRRDDGARNGEPKSHARAFGGEKGSNSRRNSSGAIPRPLVYYCDFDLIASVGSRLDRETTRRIRRPFHRVHAIDQQIDQDLQ